MRVRPCTPADLDGYLAVQEEEWGDQMAATVAQLESRLQHVGEWMLVAEHEDRIVGGATFMLLDHYDLDEHLSWTELTDDGWCATHRPDGDILFGVDLSVSRRAPRTTAGRMFMAAMEASIRTGVRRAYWGSRIPRFHQHIGEMSANEYIRARGPRGRLIDPELQLYSRIPGTEVIGVVPEYFKDWESADYGAIIEWRNPVHGVPFARVLAPRLTDRIYRRARNRRA